MCQKGMETTDDFMREMAQMDLYSQTELFELCCFLSWLGFHGVWLSFS
jgi:hypothetical protein